VSTKQEDMSCGAQLIFSEARAAQERLKSGNAFNDWLIYGTALVNIRSSAMAAAHTNKPEGRRYCAEIGALLKEHDLDGIGKGARSCLLKVMEHKPEIEAWLATLPIAKRLKLNHPQTVFSAWKRATAPPKEEKPEPKPELCGIWKSALDGDRRAAVDAAGIDHLYASLSPGMRAQLEQRLANPHAVNRLAEKDAKEKQVVEEANEKIAERCPTRGNVTAYDKPTVKPKVKAAKPTKPTKNIKKWKTTSLAALEDMITMEQKRSYELRDKGGISDADFTRLDKMRERRDALKKTEAAVARQGNGGDPTEEAKQRMADNGKRFAEAPEATAA
jgi:hypothetical protein